MNFAYLCPIKGHTEHLERLRKLPNIVFCAADNITLNAFSEEDNVFLQKNGDNHIYAQNELLDYAKERGLYAVKIIHAADHCLHYDNMFLNVAVDDVVYIGNWLSTSNGYIQHKYSIFRADDSVARQLEREQLRKAIIGSGNPAIGTPTNWWLPRSVIEKVRFDERLIYWSDVDFINQCVDVVDVFHVSITLTQIIEDDTDTCASYIHRDKEPEHRRILEEKWLSSGE